MQKNPTSGDFDQGLYWDMDKKIGDLSVPYQTSLFCACMVCKGELHSAKIELLNMVELSNR